MNTQDMQQLAGTTAAPSEDDGELERVPIWLRRLTLSVCTVAAIAGGALAASFSTRQSWVGGAASLLFVGLAILAEGVPKAAWLSEVVFGGFTLLAAVSIWLGNPPEWALVAVAAALTGWDLHHLRVRLAAIENLEAPSSLVWGHLRRLTITILSGIALGLLALYVRISYGVVVVVVLGLLAVIGISRAIAYMRRFSD